MAEPALFAIENLHARTAQGGIPILKGIDLSIGAGEVHAVMGPNGSGKSTLAQVLLGSPEYEVTEGRILFRGDDITDWDVEVRAKAGVFLAFQYPQEIPGVSVHNFLRQAMSARKGIDLSVLEVRLALMEWMQRLEMDPAFANRYLNEGFSGGEKKRNEVLQMALLQPEVAVLDETDSGLDVDALRIVARGVQEVRKDRSDLGIIVITHYQRLLDELTPDHVHILVEGRIVDSGGPELARRLEAQGYEGMARMTDTTTDTLDVAAIKADFPLLQHRLERGHPIVFLDSAASSQKPRQVIDAMSEYYERHHANVHRGAYQLAEEATDAQEGARTKLARFINAASTSEVVFTRNATESINLVAQSWGRANLGLGDAVVLSHLEHHSNIVPWQMLAAEKGFEIRWIGLTDDGQLDLTNLEQLLDGASLLAISAASNVLGTLTPVARLAAIAHDAGAKVLVDACQYVPHHRCDVQALGADWIAFSAHKMCGPTGIGALWGREAILDAMPPFLGGGSMILNVTLDGFTTAALPHKFEAGTPAIAEAVGFGAAVDYLDALGMDNILAHEQALTAYAFRRLTERYGEDLRILGSTEPGRRCGLASFVYKEVHPHDLSQVLDERGVCVRAGHHCAKPLMRQLGVSAAARASWYLYNDRSDIDALVDAIGAADALFDW